MDHNPSFTPDYYLSQAPAREYTPPHNYTRIVVPTQGYDVIFNRKLADFMELSYQNPEEAASLRFLIDECYRQMGDCYHHTHSTFLHTLQGNPGEVNVPGYPAFNYLSHYNFYYPDKTSRVVEFVTIFREAALTFFALVNPYAPLFQYQNFVYNKYIAGGWVFYIQPRSHYEPF